MDDEMDLRQFMNLLWRKRYAVSGVILVSVLSAGLFSLISPPTYEAEALVVVASPQLQIRITVALGRFGSETVVLPAPPRSYGDALVELAKSPALIRKLTKKVSGTPAPGETLAEALFAQTDRSASLVKLKVRGRDANRVARIANLWGEVLVIDGASVLSSAQVGDQPQLKLVEGITPMTPVAPRTALNILLSALFGFVAGAILAFATDHFGTRASRPVTQMVEPVVSDPPRHKAVEP